jgi:uncharacterized membrane protein YuzA (DUF378 family)
MLDNLVNANLPGLVGTIQYSTQDLMMPSLFGAAAGFILVFFVIIGLTCLFSTRSTKKYRQKLVDMYIAGTIRKLAKDEGIDLDEEYKTFVKELKKKNLDEQSLDNVIEAEKAEQYLDAQDKKLNKK